MFFAPIGNFSVAKALDVVEAKLNKANSPLLVLAGTERVKDHRNGNVNIAVKSADNSVITPPAIEHLHF